MGFSKGHVAVSADTTDATTVHAATGGSAITWIVADDQIGAARAAFILVQKGTT